MAGRTDIQPAIRFDLNTQEANEMFLSPLFVSDNILTSPYFRVMRNVKQKAVMYYAGGMSGIVQLNTGCGWTPEGKMDITQREIETCKHRIQVELCTDEFWNTCFEYLTGSEENIYQLDDTELGQRVLDFWLTRLQQGAANDIFCLAFYGDTDSTLPFFAQCDGWFKQIEADIVAGLTPATVPTGSGAPLAAGASVAIFDAMMSAQTDELDDLEVNQKVILVSRSVYNNYRDYLKANPNCCDSWQALQDGIMELFYCGIRIVKCSQWDAKDALLGNPDTHRAVLTFIQTLTIATDINGSEAGFNIRFEEREKTHEIEAYFRLGFNVAHPELLVYAK